MVPLTRRHLLRGAVGLIAGLAGCNGVGTSGSSNSTQTSTPAADRDGSGTTGNAMTDLETARVRVADDRPPVWLAALDRTEGRPATREHSRYLSSIIVDSQARAERVEIVDSPAAEHARSFIANTSFDSETIYIQNHRVEDCFRLHLCALSWHSETIETDYARTVLPYDERCEADDWVAESWLIRIPAALSERAVTSHATSVGSAACDRTDGRGEATGTPETNGTAAAVVSASNATTQRNTDSGGGT